MRKEVPLLITILTALIVILAFFLTPLAQTQQILLRWYAIIGGFAMFVGVWNLLKKHVFQVSRGKNTFYSLVLVLGFFMTFAFGIYSIVKYKDAFYINSPFMFNFNYVLAPLQSTMFSLLAFFMASAAFRAFRIRRLEAALLLFAASIVMLGRVPAGYALWHKLPLIAEWIMKIPSMAVQRGIGIGITLGAVGMSLRIILGIERPYLR